MTILTRQQYGTNSNSITNNNTNDNDNNTMNKINDNNSMFFISFKLFSKNTTFYKIYYYKLS